MTEVVYILIPGLGDQKRIFGWFYDGVARRWRRKGMKTAVFRPRWISSESYQEKQERLRRTVQHAADGSNQVILVGVSAGAALCVGALKKQSDIGKVVLICPFVRLKESDRSNKAFASQSWFKAGVAAEVALESIPSARRKNILCLISRSDRVVEPERQVISGATNVRMHSRGHLVSIAVALYLYRRRIARFSTSTN